MKEWHKIKLELFKKQPYYLTGCDNYGIEQTGEITYLTLHVGDNHLEIIADRDYRSELDLTKNVAFDTKRLYFLNTQSGQRVR